MLRNLLDNASRYACDRVIVTVAKPEPGVVRVEVRDDGSGIPAADRERIFERFARVDEARDRGHGQLGSDAAAQQVRSTLAHIPDNARVAADNRLAPQLTGAGPA